MPDAMFTEFTICRNTVSVPPSIGARTKKGLGNVDHENDILQL
jgi:hypothetical protein